MTTPVVLIVLLRVLQPHIKDKIQKSTFPMYRHNFTRFSVARPGYYFLFSYKNPNTIQPMLKRLQVNILSPQFTLHKR